MKTAVVAIETPERNVKKIAVSVCSDERACAAVDAHFGRAPFFVVVCGEDDIVECTTPNDAAQAGLGAGTRAASAMIALSVTDVISGQFGPKAREVLEKQGVRLWTASTEMTAGEAVAAFRDGELARFRLKVYG